MELGKFGLVSQLTKSSKDNKVTIVGNSGNGECIVTTIFQRSFDPKSGHTMELKIERSLAFSCESYRLIGPYCFI
ncbi:hypothetical protein CFP56_012714 [Quercus suber]|uniref:Uncharacterized protein n=1 Tax=Quercus suber TaxID=58331 RepID=A0AAW0KXE6_QUESU